MSTGVQALHDDLAAEEEELAGRRAYIFNVCTLPGAASHPLLPRWNIVLSVLKWTLLQMGFAARRAQCP